MKKGISFIILVATVAVMLILMTTAVISGTNTSNNSKKLSFAMELNTLQIAVDSYFNSNGGNLPVGDSVVVDVSNLGNEFRQQFLNNGETITGDNIVLSEIDYSKIGYSTLKYGTGKEGENDIYAVSPVTGKVYYVKGFNISSDMYFTLTSELNELINYSTSNLNMSVNPYVIFSTSNNDWTNQDITLNAKIPLDYEVDSILVNGVNYSSSDVASVSGGKSYTINCTENSNVIVKCHSTRVTSKTIEAKYSVKNIDKRAPKFTINSVQNRLNSSDNESMYGYLVLDNVSDDLSGIKYMKYENNSAYDSRTLIDEQRYTMKGHFEVSGIDIVSKTIPIDKNVRQITVYIEDNAGNWSIQTVDINI